MIIWSLIMKKALFVWGGWQGHEPEQCTRLVSDYVKDDFDCEITNSLEVYEDLTGLKGFDVIVQCVTMGGISEIQEKNLIEAVGSGVGLAGWHGGLCDSFRNNPNYQFMTGGQWVAHPGGDKAEYTVNIIKKDDPVVQGIEDFAICSEQYYLLVDPGCNVLATTDFSGEYEGIDWIKDVRMPTVWKKPWGRGRVFYSALGHIADDFRKHKELCEIMRRGMLWAAGQE